MALKTKIHALKRILLSIHFAENNIYRHSLGFSKLYHSCVQQSGSASSASDFKNVFSRKLLNTSIAASPLWYTCRSSTRDTNGNDSGSVNRVNKRTEVTYEELLDLIQRGDVLLIDVREPKEIQQTGLMPGAVNIPITKLKNTLSMSEEKYQHEYNLPKPTGLGENLIFYGFSNIKSEAALELAHKASFKKARHFPGGWKEWSVKQTTDQ